MEENTRSKYKVVDASVVIAELLPDETLTNKIDKDFHQFIKGQLYFVTPILLKYEIANALKSAILQKRLTLSKAQKLLARFLDLPFIYFEIKFNEVLELAIKENTSVYDAAYLYLARSNNWQLLSLDKKLSTL